MHSKDFTNVQRRVVTRRSALILAAVAASAFAGATVAADEQSLEARIATLEKQVQQISERTTSAPKRADRDGARGSQQAASTRTFWEEYWTEKALDRN